MLKWAMARKRTVVSWALYDWAAQPFFTVVLTFIFGPYFQAHVAPTVTQGQAWWGYGSAAAGAGVALTAPFVGAWVDASGKRLTWLMLSMALMSVGLAATWYALPGVPDRAVLTLAGIVLATLGAEYGILITNAMMPDLAAPKDMGKLSGFGWAIGYLGGLALLCFVLFTLVFPDQPMFGLSAAAHEPDRIVGPLAIVWLWVFALPLLLLAPTPKSSAAGALANTGEAFGSLFAVIRDWRAHKNVLLYLVSRMLYYDGVTAVYLFGGLYAAGTLGWETTQLGIFGIALILAGAIGTALGGRVDDAIGSKKTVAFSLFGIMAAVVGILSIETERVLFVIPTAPHVSGFSSLPAQLMLGFGVGVGLFLGPVQSASRTLMARISPPEEINTFFGLYALTGRATAFVAPLVVAAVTDISGSRRAGIASVLVLLALGFILLMAVKERRDLSDGNDASR